MECEVCRQAFDLTARRPLVMLCGHTFCRECVEGISDSGQFTCPLDQMTVPMNDINNVPSNLSLIAQLQALKTPCNIDNSKDATRFCKVHLRMLCDQCTCGPVTDCDFLAIKEDSEIKHILVNEIEKCPRKLLPHTLRQDLDKPMRLGFTELMRLLAATSDAMDPMKCCVCKGSYGMVNCTSLKLYCNSCGEALKVEDPEAAVDTISCAENSEVRTVIRTTVRLQLRNTNFHSLTMQQAKWLTDDRLVFREFLKIARELIDLPKSTEANARQLPKSFYCPRCSKFMHSEEYALRRLPCLSAFHAICESCAQLQGDEGTLECPLDGHCFLTSALKLDPVVQLYPTEDCKEISESDPTRKSNFMDADPIERSTSPPVIPAVPTISGIVGSDMYLVGKGMPIPSFDAAKWLPYSIPKAKIVSANRFVAVLPSLTEQLEPPTPEERSFLAPWLIDRYDNQVEALTLVCCANVKLLGIGIANPIDAHKKAIVQFVKMYQGDEAKGPCKEMNLLNNELLGSAGVVTDVYFAEPFLLTAFAPVTLKMKLVPLPECCKSTFLFHGNHIGRREDLIGTDEIGWDAVPTLAVEDGETNSGQQHFIGPILRLLYESPIE